MAIDFPDSPSVNDTFTAGGKVYQWDGTVWEIYGPNVSPGTFKIDDVNNRVGIGTATPEYALHVDGDVGFNDAATANFFVSSGTGADVLPSGTTAQRPASPTDGMIRYNSQLNQLESYVDGSWVVLKKSFEATGGDITESGGYKIHTFTSSGTFSVSSGSSEIEYIVVAGGGGGGRNGGGGDDCAGGGAGGYRSSVSGESSGGGASAESTLTLGVGNYSVIVGAGGASDTDGITAPANDGSDSSFYTVTSVGGGSENRDGGSGGGQRDSGGTPGVIGSGTTGQGYAGGSNTTSVGGGGGGAGEAGNTDGQGYGGDGVASLISGSLTYYAGGGGAGYASGSTQPGLGGGGAGGSPPQNGTANTGGGGGGASSSSGSNGGAGGSGIVIIRYLI